MQLLKAPDGKGGRTTSRCGGGSGRFGVPVDCADGPMVWGTNRAAAATMARIAVFPFVFDVVVVVFIATLR